MSKTRIHRGLNVLIASGLMWFALCSSLIADVPRLIHYQGKLRDAAGAAVTDTISVRFLIYDHATSTSTVLFDETHGSVGVANGLFNVLIGSQVGGVPDSAIDAGEVWLGVSINDGDELVPRTHVVSETHAIKSASAERLVRPGTYQAAVSIDPATGFVGINESNPLGLLTLNGNGGPGDGLRLAALGSASEFDIYNDGNRLIIEPVFQSGGEYQFKGDAGDDFVTLDLNGGRLSVRGVDSQSGNYFDLSSFGGGLGSGDVFTVTAGGDIGVGVPNPAARLDVAGDLKIADGTEGAGKVLTSDADGLATWQDPAPGGQWSDAGAYIHADNATDVVVTDTGEVGIGNTTPTSKLEVFADAGDIFQASGPEGPPTFNDWQQTTGAAPWIGRDSHACVTHNGRLYIIGGNDLPGDARNDVWYSTDGVNWTQDTANAPWQARWGLVAFSYNGKIYITGGSHVGNDVWSSIDGVAWGQDTGAAPWGARNHASAVVFDNKMYFIGGRDSAYRNEVWWSANGSSWTLATGSAGWSARWFAAAAAFDNKLWFMAGAESVTRNDVWTTIDGATWTQMAAAPWPVRSSGSNFAVTHDNALWILGGADRNDVWCLGGTPAPVVMKFTAGGTLGIGTTSPNAAYLLDVAGGIRCQGVTQTSTMESKTDIRPLSDDEYGGLLSALERTPLFHYRYKTASPGSQPQLGFIAERSAGELLSADGNGIDLHRAVACLLAALKAERQQAECREQESEARAADLRTQLQIQRDATERLEARLRRLEVGLSATSK